MRTFEIEILRHRGFCPKYYENSYPSYGSKEQAGDMKNMSLLDPSVLCPGKRITDLTNGNQAGAITTLIKGILRMAVASGISYGVGGAKLYKFSATSVTNAGDWPHTIDKGAVTGEDGEDVSHYQGKLFYSYNHSGSAGDIGMYDLGSTFDDDYWTAAISGGALQSGPHQLINGGDDVMYIANGLYIGYLDGATPNAQGLDFWQNSVVASLTWNYNRVLAAVNRPNISGVNVNQSAIYKWDGFSDTWDGDPVEVNGRIGALFTKNGITYVWYEAFLDGAVRLIFGILSGGSIQPIRTFSGTLPAYYQVGEMGDYIVWLSGEKMLAYGPVASEVPVDLFYYTSAKYSTAVGGLALPFGEIMIASTDNTNYSLGKEDTYATDANYKTMLFQASGKDQKSIVDNLIVNVDQLATGAQMDLTLKDNKGTSLWTGSISYAGDGAVTKKVFHPRAKGENIRLEYDHSNGSATNPVKVRQAFIKGRNIPIK